MVAEVQTGSVRDYPAYLHFTPRPDQPEKWDEQTSFYEDQSSGVCFLLGGNGCLGKEQELYNLDKLEWIKCSEITEPFRTLGVGPSGVRIQYSTPVYEKGTAELYRVTFRSCPHPIVCTSLHRVLTDEGWKTVGELTQGSRVLRAMASDYPDASHILHDDTSFQETVQAYLPDHQSHAENDAVHLLASEEVACELLTDDVVEDIEYVRTDVFYDITCFPDSNYLTKGGIISHNSGTTSCLVAKICRFVLETPPPRKDTPFWVISESYQQCGSMFDEKFDQQGHLPPHVIDRERIQWHKVNNNWPFRVPLKSPPGSPGKNWCLEFKSWRQGRGQMQARSLGGFGFIEQFPWGVFEEVLRGCREYNFPGSKLVEYTPVDPDMSVDIEEMIEAGYEPENGKELGRRYLPRNWKIYHANTACAAEAGHVDRGWFEEFFGMVPEDMLDTRMKGLFSTFEGVIYKGFSPEIHCMGDEMWPRIRYCPHRRGIDWGAGPENDFACAWGARNGLGQWFVYDSHSSNDQLKTTVDHLSDVYEQWEWPEDNSLYGTTYADPSSPDNIRIAGKMRTYNPAIGNFSIQRGRNSVLEGIEHIQYLLKPQVPVPVVGLDGKPKLDADGNQVIKLEPKLFFHRQNCAKLIGQMKTYRWLRGADPSTKASRNPRDPARQPLKKNDHLCLAGDVRVLMANNTMIPISQISVGDWVLSHLGITQVVAIECTGVEHVVQFEGPTQVISCTPDHPWYNNFGEYDDMANALWLMRLNPWAQKVITDIPEEHGRHLKPRQNLKAFFVKEISPFDKQEPVYSLATEDGTYFADGLLCSNCDALRYMCFSDDFMSGSTISSATFRSGLNTQLDGHYLPQGDIRHIRTDHRGRN